MLQTNEVLVSWRPALNPLPCASPFLIFFFPYLAVVRIDIPIDRNPLAILILFWLVRCSTISELSWKTRIADLAGWGIEGCDAIFLVLEIFGLWGKLPLLDPLQIGSNWSTTINKGHFTSMVSLYRKWVNKHLTTQVTNLLNWPVWVIELRLYKLQW